MNARKEGPSQRKDTSVAVNSVLLWKGNRQLNILDQSIQVTPRGMVFKTDDHFAPFSELRIRLIIPPRLGSTHNQTVQCDGVVVECRGSHAKKVYFVTVAFVNLPESDQKLLSLANCFLPVSFGPARAQSRTIRPSY